MNFGCALVTVRDARATTVWLLSFGRQHRLNDRPQFISYLAIARSVREGETPGKIIG
jgi:hypothetical protein